MTERMTGSLIEELSADGLKSEPNSLDSTAGLVDTTTPCRESRLTMRANLPVLPAGRRLEAAQQADSALELRQFPCFDGRKAPVAQRAAGRQAGSKSEGLESAESRIAAWPNCSLTECVLAHNTMMPSLPIQAWLCIKLVQQHGGARSCAAGRRPRSPSTPHLVSA